MAAETRLRVRWTGRWYRPVAFGLSVLILACGAVLLAFFWPPNALHTGEDLVHYLDGVRRWWSTGSPYLPNEVAGTFDYQVATFLHPPISLPFFAPWLVLPAILWWAIPLGITTALVAAWRPAPWTWPLIAFGLGQPQLHQALLWGNSNLWVMAGLGLGLVAGWPAALISIKPTLAFLALVGYRRRSWWILTGALALACLPFGSLWIDWIRVVLNSPATPDYSLRHLPWVAIPLIAWAGRTRQLPSRARIVASPGLRPSLGDADPSVPPPNPAP